MSVVDVLFRIIYEDEYNIFYFSFEEDDVFFLYV